MLLELEGCGPRAGTESGGSGNVNRQTGCGEVDDQLSIEVSGKAERRRRRKPNNGMHPTGMSANVIRQLECLFQCFPAGDAGRYVSASR